MKPCQAHRQHSLQKGEKLGQRIAVRLAEIGNNPKLVRSFFKGSADYTAVGKYSCTIPPCNWALTGVVLRKCGGEFIRPGRINSALQGWYIVSLIAKHSPGNFVALTTDYCVNHSVHPDNQRLGCRFSVSLVEWLVVASACQRVFYETNSIAIIPVMVRSLTANGINLRFPNIRVSPIFLTYTVFTDYCVMSKRHT